MNRNGTDKFSTIDIIPLRGAISHGGFYADKESDIYFGPAYLDALEWEKAQNWIGMILTPDCAIYCKEKDLSNDKLVEYKIDIIKKEFLESKQKPSREKYIRKKGIPEVFAYNPRLAQCDYMEEVYKDGNEYILCKDFKESPGKMENVVNNKYNLDKIFAINWTIKFSALLNSSFWEEVQHKDEKKKEELKEMYKNTYEFYQFGNDQGRH